MLMLYNVVTTLQEGKSAIAGILMIIRSSSGAQTTPMIVPLIYISVLTRTPPSVKYRLDGHMNYTYTTFIPPYLYSPLYGVHK